MVKSVVLPASWHQEQLKDLCLYPGEYGLNSPAIPLSPDLPLYIRITDIDDDGRYLLQHRATVIYSGKQKLLQKNDLLFARTGATVGKTYLHQDTSYPTAFAGYLIRFVPNTAKIIPYFLFLYCHTAYYWNWIKIFKARSGQPGISADEYGKMLVPCPPIAEQHRIVEVLETWDKAIQLTRELIEQKELQKKYLMQQLLSGRIRLKGFTEKWKTIKLGDICRIYQPKTLSTSQLAPTGFPVFGANGPIGFYKEYNHQTWQILITCRGATCGTVNRTFGPAWITGNAMVINADGSSEIEKLFLFYLLMNKNFAPLISGSGQPQIVRGPLENLAIIIPVQKAEQIMISSILQKADKEIDLLRQKLAKLEEQKKGLMQVLLTGKVRLAVKETK